MEWIRAEDKRAYEEIKGKMIFFKHKEILSEETYKWNFYTFLRALLIRTDVRLLFAILNMRSFT